VKEPGGPPHPSPVSVVSSERTAGAPVGTAALDVRAIHEAHADFVWASLQRLGVRDADLEDCLQEVFIVVHRRLDSYDGTSKVTTWLFGIAMRVAAAHRRRAHVRRERATEHDDLPEDPDAEHPMAADEVAARNQARKRLEEILDSMDLERRAVFVMFEVEELSCEDIAAMVGVPVGTVYSRLHKARKEFQTALARLEARDASKVRGAGR
jgi:RNA polymerase sigma-70 factor (ECF subfamily)